MKTTEGDKDGEEEDKDGKEDEKRSPEVADEDKDEDSGEESKITEDKEQQEVKQDPSVLMDELCKFIYAKVRLLLLWLLSSEVACESALFAQVRQPRLVGL